MTTVDEEILPRYLRKDVDGVWLTAIVLAIVSFPQRSSHLSEFAMELFKQMGAGTTICCGASLDTEIGTQASETWLLASGPASPGSFLQSAEIMLDGRIDGEREPEISPKKSEKLDVD